MGLKSIFDGIYIDQLIQKDDRGETIVYPHGLLGPGYAVPADREPGLRQRLRTVMLVSVAVGLVFGVFLVRAIRSDSMLTPVGWAAISVLAILLFVILRRYQARLTAGLEPVAGPRPSFGEWMRRARQSRPAWTSWFSVIVGSLMGIGSAAAIALGANDGDMTVVIGGIVMAAISTLAAWDGLLGLKERHT